jgi:phthiocerol/phenolphthiocerol synthesis type-I polyketide synthase E
VSDLEKRVADLTPEKREILARLLRVQKQPPTGSQPAPVSASAGLETDVLDDSVPRELSARKAACKHFYDTVSAQLGNSMYGQFSFFLNYGYVPDDQPQLAPVPLPEQYINRNSVKLVLEVIGDVVIDGKRVLDVGCGRGGTVHVLTNFFKPGRVTGLDLSTNAIKFCQQTHKDPRVSFHEGDAENLPFGNASFDVVTNIESSHTYPHIDQFYSEVYRVLAPNGYFLYTDALPLLRVSASLAYLQHIGFTLEHDRDITNNVLLSCDEISTTRVQAFDSRNDQEVMQGFLATPGSPIYEEMRSGRCSYRIMKLRKPA